MLLLVICLVIMVVTTFLFPAPLLEWRSMRVERGCHQTQRRLIQGLCKSATILCLLFAALLTGCATQPTPQRYAWVTGLKPEKADYYRQLHAKPWPSVNRMIKACNIQNFSIHEREIDGKLYLFAYLEYTGKDFAADMKRMAADPETVRWWKETDRESRRPGERKSFAFAQFDMRLMDAMPMVGANLFSGMSVEEVLTLNGSAGAEAAAVQSGTNRESANSLMLTCLKDGQRRTVVWGGSTPISPPSGPTQWLFQGPPAESKLLAVTTLRGPPSTVNAMKDRQPPARYTSIPHHPRSHFHTASTC